MTLRLPKTTFGRHESFGLRYGWLTKGYQALKKDPKLFEGDDVTIRLGVGRNMVNAIRYWLRACQVVKSQSAETTELGDAIFSARKGFDPFLEDEATIWLIHWLLASNIELGTAFYWFFNAFHKPVFTSQEVQEALVEFVNEKVESSPAIGTVKSDAQLILRMYTQSTGNTRTPIEEALDSPLALLRLITKSDQSRTFQSKPEVRSQLPIGVLAFALSNVFEMRAVSALPIDELMYFKSGCPVPGAVFRLTEADLLSKIERLMEWLPGVFEIRETAGIHQLYKLKTINSLELLEKHYQQSLKGIAA